MTTHFGTTAAGQDVQQITLRAGDLTATILTYGARLHDLRLAGVDYPLTTAQGDMASYQGAMLYHGAIVGPVANRISTARVRLDGMMYELERNEDGARHLHGGRAGLHAQVWDIIAQDAASVTLGLTLPDGMAGLPGRRQISAHFALTAPATLTLTIRASSDSTTLMNPANHSYWNLDGSGSWHGHSLAIAADHYLPLDAATCPTGDIADVTGTAMDLRQPRKLDAQTPPLDHNFCLSDQIMPLRDVLWLTGASGLQMVMATTLTGVQIYDSRPAHDALAIEAQHWPDAPNHSHFPNIKLRANAQYDQVTSWRFARG